MQLDEMSKQRQSFDVKQIEKNKELQAQIDNFRKRENMMSAKMKQMSEEIDILKATKPSGDMKELVELHLTTGGTKKT